MQDIYALVTQQVITALEAGVAPWVRPWSSDADPVPRNAVTQRPYRGINHLVLGMQAHCRGYGGNQWLTFHQAKTLGAYVRRGEKATPVIFYERRDTPDQPSLDPSPTQSYAVLRVFHVFNVSQIEGLGDRYLPQPPPALAWQPHEAAEQLLERSGACLRHQGTLACYRPDVDEIHLPPKACFPDAGGYYATALHELVHWTGHSSRLCRALTGRFGDHAYAMEELIAELGSAFLCAVCRVDGQLQHPSYLEHWLKVLKNDKRALFSAAAQAQSAADYLVNAD